MIPEILDKVPYDVEVTVNVKNGQPREKCCDLKKH